MVRRTSRRAVTVALTLALLGTAGLVTALSPAFSQASNGPSAAPGPAAAAGQGAAPAGRAARWNSLLRGARDLGASRAATAEVLVTLRADRRPSALLSWAARAGLRATWFTGQPAAMLTARPAVLGRRPRGPHRRLPAARLRRVLRVPGQRPRSRAAGRRGHRGRPHHVSRPGPPGRGAGGVGRGRAVPRGVREHLRHPAAVEPGRPGPGPDHRVLRGGRLLPRRPGHVRGPVRAACLPEPAAGYRPGHEGGRRKRHGHRGGPRDRARRRAWST